MQCSGGCQQGHVGSETLLQQNPPVLHQWCQLTQVDLYNGLKLIADIVDDDNGYTWSTILICILS